MSEPTTADEQTGISPRARKAFLAGSIVVLVIVAIALGYASFRDPGPEPAVPPSISGTDDGALKRAIIHYLGTLESDDPTLRGKSTARVEAGTPAGAVEHVTFTFKDGRTRTVTFTSTGSDDGWHPSPTP